MSIKSRRLPHYAMGELSVAQDANGGWIVLEDSRRVGARCATRSKHARTHSAGSTNPSGKKQTRATRACARWPRSSAKRARSFGRAMSRSKSNLPVSTARQSAMRRTRRLALSCSRCSWRVPPPKPSAKSTAAARRAMAGRYSPARPGALQDVDGGAMDSAVRSLVTAFVPRS
jgi:hypothetical protein